jgi:hypothetical protein
MMEDGERAISSKVQVHKPRAATMLAAAHGAGFRGCKTPPPPHEREASTDAEQVQAKDASKSGSIINQAAAAAAL